MGATISTPPGSKLSDSSAFGAAAAGDAAGAGGAGAAAGAAYAAGAGAGAPPAQNNTLYHCGAHYRNRTKTFEIRHEEFASLIEMDQPR
jgi:hypothetical protein